MRHPFHSNRIRFMLPGMVELLRQWNLNTNTRVRKYYDDYKLLKDVLHRPRQRSLEKLSTKNFWKSLWVTSSIFRILKQTPGPFWSFWICKWTRIDWQPTLDGGSQTKQSVVSFSLCRSTEAQHPLHFKRRDPFSRHQRSHHLFWQVLWFPLPLL